MNEKDAIYQPDANVKDVLKPVDIIAAEVEEERKKQNTLQSQNKQKKISEKNKTRYRAKTSKRKSAKKTKHATEPKQAKENQRKKTKNTAVRPLDSLNQPDSTLELSLRPARFADFTGQDKVKERLEIAVAAAKQRGDVLDHILLNGPPGLGKTTMANIVAKAMNAGLKNTSGPTIEKAGDLAGLLTNLERGDVLFIDEIHRMQKNIEEYLYPAMEDFKLDIIIDQGPNARSVRINLPNFTLIGATTRSGLLSSPLLSRFPIKERLDYYSAEQLCDIVVRSSRLLNVSIEKDGAWEIARRSRGTPRIANNLLRRVRDYAQVRHDGSVTKAGADQGLAMLDIDQNGLDEMDKRILETILLRFDGGPVGIRSLAVAVGEEADTLEAVYEPWLIMEGYLKRTPQGRTVTKISYEKFGLSPPKINDSQSELL